MTESLPVPDPPPGADAEDWDELSPELKADAARVVRNLLKPIPPPADNGDHA